MIRLIIENIVLRIFVVFLWNWQVSMLVLKKTELPKYVSYIFLPIRNIWY